MRIESLIQIIEVAKRRSISSAAQVLYTEQTTLSASIRSVEKELGYAVFKRDHRGVSLTPEGESFLPHAQAICNHYQEMETIGKRKKTDIYLLVDVMLFSWFSAEIAPSLFSAFPHYSFRLFTEEPTLFLSTFEKASADLKIAVYGTQSESFRSLPHFDANSCSFLFSAEVMMYVTKDNPLAKKDAVKLEDAAGQTAIRGMYSDRRYDKLGMKGIVRSSVVLQESMLLSALASAMQSDSFALFIEPRFVPDYENRFGSALKALHVQGFGSERQRVWEYLIAPADNSLTEKQRELVSWIKKEITLRTA